MHLHAFLDTKGAFLAPVAAPFLALISSALLSCAYNRLPLVPAVQHGQRMGAGKVLGANIATKDAGVVQQTETEDGR